MSFLILVINPGSTSTKVALYEDEAELWSVNAAHDSKELEKFPRLYDQFEYRRKVIIDEFEAHGVDQKDLACVMGRGGLFPPVETGGYKVNEAMKNMIAEELIDPHASNLGCVLAASVAEPLNIPAYVYDCVSSDEMSEIAHITGLPEIRRNSLCHVLNSRAVTIEYAKRINKPFEELDALVAHLGGGITMAAIRGGRIIDSLADDAGPFAPERTGSIPLLPIIDVCYSGIFNRREMKRRVRGMGGLKALLGTSDCREIERRIAEGDEKAKLYYDAQVYQVAKGIGLLAPVFKKAPDVIILTGGLAFSEYIVGGVKEYVDYIAPVEIIPGEFEMEALARGAYRILLGQEEAKEFVYKAK